MKRSFLFMAAGFIMAACTSNEEVSTVADESRDAMTEEVLKSSVTGQWTDPVMYGHTETVRLYSLEDDGTCQVSDLTETEGQGLQVVSLQQGTWTVTTETADDTLAADVQKEGMRLVGMMTLRTEPVVSEESPLYETYVRQKESGMDFTSETEMMVVRLKDSDDVAFIGTNEFYYLKMMREVSGGDSLTTLLRTMKRGGMRRGASAADLVSSVSKGKKVDMSDWMGTFYKGQNPRVCDMSIPGAHDAFSSYMSGWNPGGYWAKTQTLSIEQQWAAGVRYFDARVKVDGGRLMLYHTFSLNISFREVLRKLRTLLNSHKQETAILIVNFDSGSNPQMVKNELQTELGGYMLTGQKAKPGMRLNDCKGKVLVINRYSTDASVGATARASWTDNTKGKEGKMTFANGSVAKLYLQDFYHYPVRLFNNQRKDKKNAITKTLDYAAKATGTSQCTWVLNHQSGYSYTLGGVAEYATMDYADNSKNMNPVVESWISKNLGKKTGIVILDFAGSRSFSGTSLGGMTSRMVAMNNYYLVRKRSISLK